MMFRSAPGCFALVLVVASVGCTGQLVSDQPGGSAPLSPGSGGDSPASGAPPPSGVAPGPSAPTATGGTCPAAPPASVALRRLSNVEYDNTVRDLLNTTQTPGRSFLEEDEALGFRNIAAALTVPPALAEQYAEAAAGLATEATKNVSTLAPCSSNASATAERTCADTFIRSFGRRAFRRPLAAAELQAYTRLYEAERGRASYASAVGIVVETMLQSPHFLYRAELGAGTPLRLTPHEIATQISYMVTGSMPDTDLSAAADGNRLSTPEQIEAQVRRLLMTPRANGWLRGFVMQWLGTTNAGEVPKDLTVYPAYDDALRASIAQEAVRFVDAILAESKGSIAELFGAGWTYLDARLARHYGVPAPTGAGLQRVTLPADQRAGVLTQAAFLASHSKPNESFPITRGKFLRQRVLCRSLPPPPPDANIVAPRPSPDMTTRERFAQHSANPTCAACHKLIDPLGFAFETYDGTGAFRTTENGKPVVTAGELVDVAPEVDGPFAGAVPLMRTLAPSRVVSDCAAQQAFRWALGREETSAESCLIGSLAGPGADLREILVAIARSDRFVLRAR